MDVGGWLRGLGLGQYEEQFRDNKIDADLLPRLTVDDLKDIGVSVVGDRRRLLDAIAAIAGAGPASPAKSAPSKGFQTSAERRPITVLFCDLVGSTGLAAKLDAEDWRNLVNAYLDEASAAVTGLGGHVLKKLGDGLMALFGYPHAQENDAERAVRAALAIQLALVEINARNSRRGAPELSARIGLDSGQVVVDATGEVFGEAPNIAARVQGAAEPGSILITATVQRQTAGLFVVEDRGQHELKGISAPMTLYRIVRASGGGRRGGARVLTPLVGREEELDLLGRRWQRARNGEGQLGLIVGEPGLGKSRLMEEFHGRLGETPHTWVEWSSSQLLQNTPLHPIAEWGRQRFGADLPAEQRLADLENTLGLIGLDATEYAPLLAPLVDVFLPEDRAAKLAPEELRRRQLAAMTAWILAAARTQAIVLAFEDLHWADPTSLDLMRALAERGAQAPLLIIATARPEFRAPWSVRSHHSVISLSPLDSSEIAKMVRDLSSRHALPKDIVEGVSERTGGVPLFVEEVTRLLLERGEQGGAQAIPPTLQQSLAARLDRLGSARETAQIGAVLGRGFSYALLRSVAALDEGALRSSLERLAEADILFVEGDGAQATYRFKHALIQDAAYDSLLKSRRQALHARAAGILGESASPEPEAIAHHFTQAGLDDLAIEWWGKAGDQALRRSAFQEAIAHLGKAIEMADKGAVGSIGTIPEPSRLKLQTNYAQALVWSKGFSAEETRAAFERTGDLATRAELPAERFPALFGQYLWNFLRGDTHSARGIAERFLQEAEAQGRLAEAGVGHRLVGLTSMFLGDLADAHIHLEVALSTYDRERDSEVREKFAHDTGVAARVFLALASWLEGDPERANRLIGEATALADDLGHLPSVIHTLWYKVHIQCLRNDPESVLVDAERLLGTSKQHRVELFVALSDVALAWARGRLGDPGRGANELRRLLTDYRSHGNRLWVPTFLALLTELEDRAGDPERALASIDEGLATARESGQCYTEGFLHRLRGDLLLKLNPDDPEPAIEAYTAAIDASERHGTRIYKLLASLSLAKLYQSTGRSADAHAVLAPALEGFSPTPEMQEIAEAQALLASLAETDELKAAEAQRRRRLHLQTAYGQAMMYSKGFAAEETKVAFARAAELAAKTDDFSQRFAAAHGQWTVALVRGELKSARDMASAFLQEEENQGHLVEAGIARRGLALICYLVGDFCQARVHCERALATCEPERDREARERFSEDTGCIAMSILATTSWQLGEVERARELIDMANRRAAELDHAPSMAHPLQSKFSLELLRGDPASALAAAEALAALGRDHGMPHWLADAELYAVWARCRLHDPTASAALAASQGARSRGWFSKALLAELELRTHGVDSGLARIEEALALARQDETRRDLALPYLLRGEFLLKCDPPNPAAAEEAFQSAIAIAKEQGARSWGLRAALALAKLYQSTGRPVEAHAVLAPGLEGFAPTPEMPEIAEAQTLLTALAATDEVKVAAAHRQRLTQLHVSYGNALIAARGYGAPETTKAFAKAREAASGDKDAPGRLAADYGLWAGSYMRGELSEMRTHAMAFLNDLEATPDSPAASVARRLAGVTCWCAGEYREARDYFEKALALFQPGRDDDMAFRFGQDPGIAAMANLAIASWPLGEVDRAMSVIDAVETRMSGVPHIGTLSFGRMHAALFELMRGDQARGAPHAVELVRLSRHHELPMWGAFGVFLQGWATSASGAIRAGLDDMRQAVDSLRAQNVVLFDGLVKIALAEAEAAAGDLDRALAVLDEGLATADRVGNCAFEAELHRARGDILLQRDPANSAPAEEAFLTALAVAKQQGTRSFELRAALALAKLYQSTGRPADAHAVLAPALEGFPSTTKMPEIAEAQPLLVTIRAGV